jgi:hypothetical protein
MKTTDVRESGVAVEVGTFVIDGARDRVEDATGITVDFGI